MSREEVIILASVLAFCVALAAFAEWRFTDRLLDPSR